jgi:MAP3K TRAFs-binding domain
MPFGRKSGPGGIAIDFDAVYQSLIASAIRDAGLEPLRADEEQLGGVIHKPMIERLMLCEHAIADLTTANANVFHELGLRHRIKPFNTTLIFAERGGLPPVDVGALLRLPGPDGKPSRVERDRAALVARLNAARERQMDSLVSLAVDGVPDMQRLNIDDFRDRGQYAQQVKARLAAARKGGLAALRGIEAEIAGLPGGIGEAEAGVIVDLFLSYRDIKAWPEMIALVPRMAAPLAAATMIREQLGFALNRAGDADEAERVLLKLIADRGASSETCGILGRVYKDRWDTACAANEELKAKGWLKKAIDMYLRGFETD